jgi:hypothetical protein
VCETPGPSRIGSACYGFECINNLGDGDRCRNLYRRGCPEKWRHTQICQDPLLLVSTFAEGVGLTGSRCVDDARK